MWWWTLLPIAGLSGWSGYQFWRGLKLRRVRTQYFDADRAKDPAWFWFFFIFYGVCAPFLALVALWIVLGTSARP
jgi:hypothetical protein